MDGLPGFQLLGWLMVFLGLIITNEIARRSKKGGVFFFLLLPAGLTVGLLFLCDNIITQFIAFVFLLLIPEFIYRISFNNNIYAYFLNEK